MILTTLFSLAWAPCLDAITSCKPVRISRAEVAEAVGMVRRYQKAKTVSNRADDLAGAEQVRRHRRVGAVEPRQRGGPPLGRLLEPAGVALLDLGAERGSLAEAARGFARVDAAGLADGLHGDLLEAGGAQVPLDPLAVG